YYYYLSKKRLFFDFNVKIKDTIQVDLLIRNLSNHDSIIPKFRILVDTIFYVKDFNKKDSLLSFSYKIIDSVKSQSPSMSSNVINKKVIFGPSFFTPEYINYRPALFPRAPFESESNFICYEEPTGYVFMNADHCYGLGVSEINNFEKSISIFPNPSSGEFTLEVNGNLKPKKITVYTVLGDLVKTEVVNDGKNFKISLKEKTSGNYFVVVELEPARTERGGNDVRVVKRIVVGNQ
ncbi:MAG: T9SS type A sorting domain-containing protein, partial [Bacteroidia bacterium]